MPNLSKIRQGLEILETYSPKGWGGAEHDIFYSCVEIEKVSPEDAAKLEELGWHKDTESGSWAAYT